MYDFEKNRIFFLKRYWIFCVRCIILSALFSPLCTLSAKEKTEKVTARVRLSHPETEGKLAENKKKLAKLESENVRLNAENVQVKSEIAQVKSELVRHKSEQLRLENELRQLNEENSILRKELLETLEKYTMQSERLKRLELSAAGIVETLNPLYSGTRDADLLSSLNIALKSGNELLLKSLALHELFQKHFSGLELDAVESARIRVAADDLKKASMNFALLGVPPNDPGGFTSCRVLELNDTLKVVLLSAGYRNGVRAGMSLRTGEKNEFHLRVLAVRPFVAAAMLESGEFGKLSPGMLVKATGTTQ